MKDDSKDKDSAISANKNEIKILQSEIDKLSEELQAKNLYIERFALENS